MTRYDGDSPRFGVHVNGMAATFAKKATAMEFEMLNKINALHASLRRQQKTLSDDLGPSKIFVN